MGKSGGKSLKAALHSQQSRLHNKKKIAQAAQAADLKSKKGPPKSIDKAKCKITTRNTVPFRPNDKILLIGEGNFSFARALVDKPPAELEFLPASNITATAYDSEKECYEKYPDAEGIVKDLQTKGVEVLFGVDATKLEKVSAFKNRTWDRVVWNFPHAGAGVAINSPGGVLTILKARV